MLDTPNNTAPASLVLLTLVKLLRVPDDHIPAILELINRAMSMETCNMSLSQLAAVSTLSVNKFYSDRFYVNSVVADTLFLPRQFMNLMELEFLKLIDFNLCVSPDEYATACI